MMVVWGILTAILILLLIPVRLALSAATGQSPRAILRYLFFSLLLYPVPEKDKQEQEKTKKQKQKPPKEPKSERDFGPLLAQLWTYFERLSAPVKKLLRRTSLARVSFRMAVVGEDAADTALRFGKVNAAAFSVVGILDCIVSLRVKRIEIIPGFAAEREEYTFSGELRVIPLAVLIAALQVGFWGLAALIKSSGATKEKKKQRQELAAEGKEAQYGKQTSH